MQGSCDVDESPHAVYEVLKKEEDDNNRDALEIGRLIREGRDENDSEEEKREKVEKIEVEVEQPRKHSQKDREDEYRRRCMSQITLPGREDKKISAIWPRFCVMQGSPWWKYFSVTDKELDNKRFPLCTYSKHDSVLHDMVSRPRFFMHCGCDTQLFKIRLQKTESAEKVPSFAHFEPVAHLKKASAAKGSDDGKREKGHLNRFRRWR